MPRGDDDSDAPARRSYRADRDVEERLRSLEAFKATLGGAVGAVGVLERIERDIAAHRRELDADVVAMKAAATATTAEHARKLAEHDHVFGKVMIAAISGGAVVGVLVNLLFHLLSK